MLPYFDNQQFLTEQNDLTIDDFLQFLYWMKEYQISNSCHVEYRRFGQSNEITPNNFEKFFIIGKMIRDHFLIADMKDYTCTMRSEPQELKKFMDSVQMDKRMVLRGLKKEYNTVKIFSKDIGFSYFMSIIDAGDDFDMHIRTIPSFVGFFLDFLDRQSFDTILDPNNIGKGLFRDIDGYLLGKRNFQGTITLTYDLVDYIDSKRYIHTILRSLEEKRKLKIHDMIIKEETIGFEIGNFVDFEESLFITANQEESPHEQQEIDSIPFFDCNTYILYFQGKERKFIPKTLIGEQVRIAFESEIGEHIAYDNAFDTLGDVLPTKEITKKGSDSIGSCNKKFEQLFGVTEFFGRGKDHYKRNY